MASVQIRHLTKRFGDDEVVRNLDLDIADGELLVIVGPSGCGKTSVLRMVAGLDEPSAGEILIDGTELPGARRGRRATAMMFQEAALYPHLRVCDNIGFPLKMAGERSAVVRREVRSIASTLGLTPLLTRRPGQLSGGQRQRVAMARSLIRRPALLLMDEPMSNLDAKLRGELRATIGHIQHRLGLTTLYVTHDQLEAMSLGHRIAVMRDGVIVQIGTPDEVYHRPVDAFVATFVGTPSMNLFVGRLEHHPTGTAVAVGAAAIPLGTAGPADVRRWVGRDVVVGVRPQSFRFAERGIVADVEHIETVGDRCMVSTTVWARSVRVTGSGVAIVDGPTRLTIDVGVADDLGAGRWRASHLDVDPDEVHLFDPDTGRSLSAGVRFDCARIQTARATT